jgi:MFS family permease
MRGRWKAFATVGFYILALMIVRASRNFVLPQWGDSLGLNATVIGIVLSAGAAMDLLLFIPAGIIMDRAGRKLAGGLCIGILSAGLLLLCLSRGIAGFVIASMLIGVGNGFGAGINMTLGTDIAPNTAVSEFLGIWRFVGDIGQTAGPAIVGGISAAAGLGPGILAIAACGFFGLGVLALLAPETLHIARRG